MGDDYHIKAELRRAQINVDLADVAIDNGLVNYNAGADFTGDEDSQTYGQYLKSDGSAFDQANDAVTGMMYVAFDMNKTDNSGTFAYFQNPGGSYGENARGMIFELTADDDGLLSGCGVSGATTGEANFADGISIRKSVNESGVVLKPAGYFHPFFKTYTSGDPQCGVSSTATDADGTYYQTSCTSPQAHVRKWYVPEITDSTIATNFVTQSNGTLVSRQCVKQNSTGKYVIDTAEITEDTGYEVIDAADTSNASKLMDAVTLDFAELGVQ